MLKERDFPIIIKPVDSFSGRGVNKVTKARDLCAAIADSSKYSRSQQIVVEQFIEGTLHSHSAFIKKYNIIQDFFVDEFCTVYPYQVDCSNIPSLLNGRIRQRVRECIHELTKLLRLNDGLLHTQFILSNEDIYLIECTRRCPGDLYYYLISFSTSMPYIENYLHPFLGQKISFPSHFLEIPYARHTISIAEDSVVYGFSHKIPSQEVKCFPLRVSGALIRRAPFDRIAILLALFSNTDTLFKITPELGKFIHIEREIVKDA
jgi:biotin carboxylase